MHVGGQVLLQVGDGGVQSLGQFDGAGIGLFGDGQQYGGLAPFGSQAELGLLGSDTHVSHVLQGHWHSALSGLDDRCGHLLYVLGGDHSAHDVFVAVFVDDTSVGVLVHASGYGHHLAEGHSVVLHLLRVNQDLILLDVASEHCHLGHASGGQQSGTECPVGQRPQIQHRGAVGGQAYDHQLSEDGGLGAEGRVAGGLWQILCGCGQFLRHDLAGQVYVGAPVELNPYYGESGGGRAAHPADSGGAVDGGLDGEGHKLLDLFGGHSVGLGHDYYRGGVEVGEYVYLGVEGPVQSGREQQYRRDQYQQPVLQGKMYYLIEHGCPGLM